MHVFLPFYSFTLELFYSFIFLLIYSFTHTLFYPFTHLLLSSFTLFTHLLIQCQSKHFCRRFEFENHFLFTCTFGVLSPVSTHIGWKARFFLALCFVVFKALPTSFCSLLIITLNFYPSTPQLPVNHEQGGRDQGGQSAAAAAAHLGAQSHPRPWRERGRQHRQRELRPDRPSRSPKGNFRF